MSSQTTIHLILEESATEYTQHFLDWYVVRKGLNQLKVLVFFVLLESHEKRKKLIRFDHGTLHVSWVKYDRLINWLHLVSRLDPTFDEKLVPVCDGAFFVEITPLHGSNWMKALDEFDFVLKFSLAAYSTRTAHFSVGIGKSTATKRTIKDLPNLVSSFHSDHPELAAPLRFSADTHKVLLKKFNVEKEG